MAVESSEQHFSEVPRPGTSFGNIPHLRRNLN